MNKNKFKIYTLGCKVNQYDSADLKKRLETLKFKYVKNNADWVIINTCAVTKTAIRKDRRMIVKAKKDNPIAKMILCGCFPKVYFDEAKKLEVDYIFKTGESEKILKLINIESSKADSKHTQNSKANDSKLRRKSRCFLKIQDGCEQFCSYCIIPYTRGKLKSRGETEVLKEAEASAKVGYQEVVLCGIHLGLYGVDNIKKIKNNKSVILANRVNLSNLIKKLLKIKNIGRIRLSSIEVNEVDDELINLMKKNKKLCPQLHIPLQSGSDKILKLMNRPYLVKNFEAKIKKLRKAIPNIAISTDVIVGFPGEGETEFRETFNFIKKINFSRLHVFPFSAHEKTPAFNFSGKVLAPEKRLRTEKLIELGEKLEKDYKKKFIGKKLEVLVEKIDDGVLKGKSEYYFEVEKRISKKFKDKEGIPELRKIIGLKY